MPAVIENPFSGEKSLTCSIAVKHTAVNAAKMKEMGLTEDQFNIRASAARKRGGSVARTKAQVEKLASSASESEFLAPPEVQKEILKIAKAKVKNAPVPSPEAVAKAHQELENAKLGIGRAGGEARGGSAKDRRTQRFNLFKEFGGEKRGYISCHGCGTKVHWAEKGDDNPHGFARFERGKIFVKCQGGGYQLKNLLPECFSCNRSRGDKVLRKENPC
jgi:hypothetical protein